MTCVLLKFVRQRRTNVLLAIALCITTGLSLPLNAQDPSSKSTADTNGSTDDLPEVKVDFLWTKDPNIRIPKPVAGFDPAYIPLWMEALQHDEADLQQETAVAFEFVHREGFADLSRLADDFRAQLSSDSHHAVQLALASLLVTLDDEASAKHLAELLNPRQIELSQIVEPALAKWDYLPIREVWRSRLNDSRVRRSHLVLAIEGLMQVQDEESADRLLEIAVDRREKSAIRVAAAKAVGNIRNDGLLATARKLSEYSTGTGIADRICAASLLVRHVSEDSNQLLVKLSLDPEPVVAAIAWHRLLQIDAALAVPQAEVCLTNGDPNIRELAMQSLKEQPTLDRIDRLGLMMDDRHPSVRKKARTSLHQLALLNDEFDKRVRIAGMKSATESPSGYRGTEQSLLLLTALDHKNVAGIAVEHLDHKHPRVMLTAAWALRVLSVEETLPGMLDRATRVSAAFLDSSFQKREKFDASAIDQVAHLFDAMGQMKYGEAEGLLRKYIPKNLTLGANARPAAVAAMGKLYEKNPDEELVKQLLKRFSDRESMIEPELDEVIHMCSIAFGRMKATQTLPFLEKDYPGGTPTGGFDLAAAWAIREITGQEYPPPHVLTKYKSGFHLEPGKQRLQSETRNP